ncbi:MAG: hypothetical protein ACP5HD_01535 [Thermoproteus sp.]
MIGQSALGMVRYGTISDYMDHTDWVRQALEMWDRRIVYYEAGAGRGIEKPARRIRYRRGEGKKEEVFGYAFED